MRKKNLKIQESGIFSEYGKIYENYVGLIESKNEGNEALKRAVFLMWFENSEPSFLTGIYGLSHEMSQKVLQSLEYKIEVGKLDFELKWMLPYYNTINEWIFDGYVDWVFGKKIVFPNIKKFLTEADYERQILF